MITAELWTQKLTNGVELSPGYASAASSTSPSPALSPWTVASAPLAAAASPPGADAWPSATLCAPAVPPPHAIPACGRLQVAQVKEDKSAAC